MATIPTPFKAKNGVWSLFAGTVSVLAVTIGGTPTSMDRTGFVTDQTVAEQKLDAYVGGSRLLRLDKTAANPTLTLTDTSSSRYARFEGASALTVELRDGGIQLLDGVTRKGTLAIDGTNTRLSARTDGTLGMVLCQAGCMEIHEALTIVETAAAQKGITYTALTVNPGAATTLWSNSMDTNRPYWGATSIALAGDNNPAGTGTELQYRASSTALGAVSGSSVAGNVVNIGDNDLTITRNNATINLIATNVDGDSFLYLGEAGSARSGIGYDGGVNELQIWTGSPIVKRARWVRDTGRFDLLPNIDSTGAGNGTLVVGGSVSQQVGIGQGKIFADGFITMGSVSNGVDNDFKIQGGTSGGRSAVHFGSNQGSETAMSGYDSDINMYFVRTKGITTAQNKFAVDRDSNLVAVKSILALTTDLSVELDVAAGTQAMSMKVGATDPGAFVREADTLGRDTFFRSQGGGAHTAGNPSGGDFIFIPGLKGAGGTGRDGRLVVQGNTCMTGFSDREGLAAPGLSAVGEGRIYFDSTSNTYKVSQNNGAYVDLVGGGGGGYPSPVVSAGTDYALSGSMAAENVSRLTASGLNMVMPAGAVDKQEQTVQNRGGGLNNLAGAGVDTIDDATIPDKDSYTYRYRLSTTHWERI